MSELLDVIIIGAGPAGLSAGIYGIRAGLKLLLLEQAGPGGQIQKTYEVDNYPGIPSVTGMELAERMQGHFTGLGGVITKTEVTGVSKNGDVFAVTTTNGAYTTKTVLLACGAHHATLDVVGEEQLIGMGVSYCATCDGAFYKDAETAVVGGGDVAVEDAIFLARFCKKVHLVHRRNVLRAAKRLQDVLFALPNVEIHWNCIVESIEGDGEVEGLILKDKTSCEFKELPVEGVFIAVGIEPDTERFRGLADTDENGYFLAGEDCATSLSGLYAAGDLRKKNMRQIITAAADGANAINSICDYLNN